MKALIIGAVGGVMLFNSSAFASASKKHLFRKKYKPKSRK